MPDLTEPTKASRFQQLALPHLDAAYNLARWLLRNNQDAEDVVQEAYLRAFKFFDSCHGGNARAWLLAIVRNTAYTWLQHNREQRHNLSFDEESDSFEGLASVTILSHPDNNPESILSQSDDRKLLNQALEQLPLEFREVLVLRELEDFSYKEIANITGIPMGTVMSRLARGRKMLWESLENMAQESPDGL